MALTLPNSFLNHSIKQNWLFQLYYGNESNFTGVAFYDTTVESIFYHGAVLNKPSIRESIDLTTSKAKTGNVSITLANFLYLNKNFSEEIYGGTRDYINRTVKIYVQPEDVTGISNCLLIYTGKLNNLSHTIDKVKLSINAQKPWDGVEVPQVKTSKNKYFPIAYGAYTPNASNGDADSVAITFGSANNIDDFRKRKTLYPIPVNELRGDTAFNLTGEWSQGQKAWPHYYEKSSDQFKPIANHGSTTTTVDSANETYGDGYAVRFHQNLIKKGLLKPAEVSSVSNGTVLTWANNNNAFNVEDDIDTSSYTECSFNGEYVHNDTATITWKMPQLTGYASALSVHLVIQASFELSGASGSGTMKLELFDRSFGASDTIGYWDLTGNGTTTDLHKTSGGTLDTSSVAYYTAQYDHDAEFLAGNGYSDGIVLRAKLSRTSTIDGDVEGYIRIYDVVIEATTQLDFTATSSSGKNQAYKFLSDINYVYTGGDGQVDNGWNSNSAITEIHEAHRDLLHRYTSYANSNTPTNWSSGRNLNSVKDWQIRYWINEPMPLIKVLEKLQYEGGFIFRFNGQGAGEYIFIPDSISADHTLNTDDLENLNISLTSMDKIITSMDIEYRKHPAISGHITKVSATNSTAISDLKIGTNENKKTIRLDAYVGDTSSENDIPTASTSNVNDDWYSYYDNILGQQKIEVDATVINPSFYGIDVGDFVSFNTMPLDAFDQSWSGKNFMVVSVTRQIGKLKCKFREI